VISELHNIGRSTLLKLQELREKPLILTRRTLFLEVIEELVQKFMGKSIDIAVSYYFRRPLRFHVMEYNRLEYLSRALLRLRGRVNIKLAYILQDDFLRRSLVIENTYSIITIRERMFKANYPEVIVFHPGFIYSRGVFEQLYHMYAREHLVNERESIRLLRNYIEWVDGYEILDGELNVKTIDGKRVSVYKLSDGQRVAVFIGLLYAIAKPPILFLIDTPEAFTHPDGLPIVADFIARLVAEGNQVVVATQSIEFLEELLMKAEQHSILNDTIVQRVMLTNDGIVKAKGKWGGEISLRSIKELGADLRR